MRIWLTALLTCVSLCACAGGSTLGDDEAAQFAGLPSPAQLDALRGSSIVTADSIEVLTPLAWGNTSLTGSGLNFDTTAPGELAWAIYRVPGTFGTPLVITAEGGTALWLMAADFSDDRWFGTVQFFTETAQLDLAAIGDATSPSEFIYFAVVATPGQSGLLRELFLTYDSAPPSGTTFYVSNSGDDGDDGSQINPWLTLQHAADVVGPGDTVIALPGDYAGFHLQTSGEPGNPITFSGPGATITSDNPNTPDGINIENWSGPPSISYVVIDDLDVVGVTRAGIRAVGSDTSFAHHITIRNCTLDANGRWGILNGHVDDMLVANNVCSNSGVEHGIYLSNSGDRNVARGNTCFGNNASGIQYNADASLGADGNMSDTLISGNVLYNNGAAGGAALNTDGLRRAVIRNNLLYDNHATGIVMYNGDGVGSGENLVVNNTVYQPADGRWCITIGDGSAGNRLYNNILWNEDSFRGAVSVFASSLPGFESDYNLLLNRLSADDGGSSMTLAQWQVAHNVDTNSVVMTDPAEVWVNAALGNFNLLTDSPAVSLGLPSIAPTVDLSGFVRPIGAGVDAGCYEYLP
ncbi:MAG: right-handed parallel beta-helix repeat-containing protein [bacterium]|nr:right-handed parallel beta-helix repeat-containing protein [bacterium]